MKTMKEVKTAMGEKKIAIEAKDGHGNQLQHVNTLLKYCYLDGNDDLTRGLLIMYTTLQNST